VDPVNVKPHIFGLIALYMLIGIMGTPRMFIHTKTLAVISISISPLVENKGQSPITFCN
jgi:hypothetical protein